MSRLLSFVREESPPKSQVLPESKLRESSSSSGKDERKVRSAAKSLLIDLIFKVFNFENFFSSVKYSSPPK